MMCSFSFLTHIGFTTDLDFVNRSIADDAVARSVCIRSYSGPHFPTFGLYSVRMPENTDQKNSLYGHFLCSGGCVKYEGCLRISV